MLPVTSTVSVWVVFRNYGCEGKSLPLGVYLTKEVADIVVSAGDYLEVREIITNSPLEKG